MTSKTFLSVSFFKVVLHMHTVPQNRDKFIVNNLFYCCKALIFTHPLIYEFLCGPKHMATPVVNWSGIIPYQNDNKKLQFLQTKFHTTVSYYTQKLPRQSYT